MALSFRFKLLLLVLVISHLFRFGKLKLVKSNEKDKIYVYKVPQKRLTI